MKHKRPHNEADLSHTQSRQRLLGYGALLLVAIIYGFYGVFIRQLSLDMSNYGQLGLRSLIALLVVVVIASIRKSWRSPRSFIGWYTLFGITSIFFPFLMILGTMLTEASSAVVMLYAGGIATAFVIGKFFFKERATPAKLLAASLLAAGLIIFGWPFSFYGTTLLGLLAGLGAGVMDGTANAVRKHLRDQPREMLLFWSILATVVAMAIPTALSSQPHFVLPFEPATLLVLALHSTAIVVNGYLLIYGFQRADINAGMVVLSAEILVAYGVNALILHEFPTPTEIIGATLIFVASITVPIFAAIQHRRLNLATNFSDQA